MEMYVVLQLQAPVGAQVDAAATHQRHLLGVASADNLHKSRKSPEPHPWIQAEAPVCPVHSFRTVPRLNQYFPRLSGNMSNDRFAMGMRGKSGSGLQLLHSLSS